MEDQINTNESIQGSTFPSYPQNPYGIDNRLINQLSSRMKIITILFIASIVLSALSTVLSLTNLPKMDYSYGKSMESFYTITMIVGFLLGLAITLALVIFLLKSTKAFDLFNQTGDIRNLNDGFYHQNRFFNLTKAIIIVVFGIAAILLVVTLISSFS
jgi:hypothetical protein